MKNDPRTLFQTGGLKLVRYPSNIRKLIILASGSKKFFPKGRDYHMTPSVFCASVYIFVTGKTILYSVYFLNYLNHRKMITDQNGNKTAICNC